MPLASLIRRLQSPQIKKPAARNVYGEHCLAAVISPNQESSRQERLWRALFGGCNLSKSRIQPPGMPLASLIRRLQSLQIKNPAAINAFGELYSAAVIIPNQKNSRQNSSGVFISSCRIRSSCYSTGKSCVLKRSGI